MVDILGGAAAGLASAGIQQMFTDYNREQDFGNYQKAQEQSFVNAQDSQRNAPLLTKLGMQAAGLNPAGMSTPTPASAAPAPLGSHASPSVSLAQDNNLMADARLKNAEAERTELQNEQTQGENEASFANYKKQVQSLESAYRNRGWTQLADSLAEELGTLEELEQKDDFKFNAGHLRGAVNAFSSVQALQDRVSNTFKSLLDTETNYKMLINGSSVPLSKMPQLQRNLLATQIANNIATHSLLASQKELTDEQKNELVKLQEKFDNEISLLIEQKKLTEYQANQIRYADWKQLMQDGEFMAAVIAKSDEQQKIIMQQAGQFANAVVNARTGGKLAQSINNVGQSKGNTTTTTHSYHYDSKGKMKGYDVNQSQGSNTMLKRSIPSWQESEW